MSTTATRLSCAALAAASILLAGCGGSSSDASAGSGGNPPPAADTTTLAGVVFSEAPCAGVPVTVTAADGTVLSADAVTGSDGSYSASFVNPPANPLLIVSASCPNADGGEDALVSVLTPGSATGATVSQTANLNGMANFMSALVTKSGDPTKLIGEVRSGVLKVDAAAQTVARDKLNAMLTQVVFAAGLSAVDPVTMPIKDSVAVKTLLQTVSIKFLPQPDGKQTVQIRLKLANASNDAGQPVFEVSNVDLVDSQQLQLLIASVSRLQISPSFLIPSGTQDLIADLVNRMNGCFKLEERVVEKAVVPACQAMFLDGDSRTFLNNNFPILRSSEPDFEPSNVNFLVLGKKSGAVSTPDFQYLRPDGLLGFTVRQDLSSDLPVTLLLDAKVGKDGKLGLSGNQSPFRAGLVARSERRTFLNQTASSYLSTGFSFKVPLQNRNGVPVTKVVVTPPPAILKDVSFTLLPGADGMTLMERVRFPNQPDQGGPDSFVRLRSEYVNGSPTQSHPSLRDFAEFFIAADVSDSAIAAIVPYAQLWKFEFYVGDTDTPELPVYYPTPARPLTIAELRNTQLPDLSAATRSALQAMLALDEPGSPGFTLLSSLPALSLTPTGSTNVFIAVHGVRSTASSTVYFRDEPLKTGWFNQILLPTAVAPNVATTVPCTNGSNGDAHCASEAAYLDAAIGTVFMIGVDLTSAPAGALEKAHFLDVEQLVP